MASPQTLPRQDEIVSSPAARKVLALLRIATGFIYLWTFLDKAFGLGYSTSSERAWINGGKPSQGFLGNLDPAKPFSGVLGSMSSTVTDVLFMLGMLGIGLAMMLGIGTRVAAVCGALMMAMLWIAVFPLVPGASESTNPLIDQHVIIALVAILIPLVYAGDTWGLGTWWKSLPIVQKNRWLV